MHSSLRKVLAEGEEMSNYVYKSPRKHIVMVSNRNLNKLQGNASETPDVQKNESFEYYGQTEATTKGLPTLTSDPTVEGLLHHAVSSADYQQQMYRKNKEDLRTMVRSVEPRTSTFRKTPVEAQRSAQAKKMKVLEELAAQSSALKMSNI